MISRGIYDALGRVSRKTFSSGQYEVFAYDTRDRVASVILRNSGGSPLRTQVYGYDASSKVTSHAVNGATTLYTYDAAGQLLTESRTGYSGSYTYDGNGNRLTRTVGGVTETYAYDDGDKLLSVSVGGSATKTYGYDAAGRTTSVVSSAGTTSLAYDFEGRATSISGPGVSQSNVYNGLDTRVGSTTNSVARTFLRDGAYVTDPVLTDGAATYTPGVSERRGSATTFLHSGLKNADAQSGTGQTVVASRQYDAFGNVASSTGTWSGPFGYAGGFGYQEDATGLKLLGHRYYDSSTGRFLTRDPIKDGRNWYVYCGNDPVGYVDVDGFSSVAIGIRTGATIGAKIGAIGGPKGVIIGAIIGGLVGAVVAVNLIPTLPDPGPSRAEHTKGARPSTKGPHQKGTARLRRDNKGEKGDERRNIPKEKNPPTQPDKDSPEYKKGPKPKD